MERTYYTIAEAAGLLGYSKSLLYKEIRAGRLKAVLRKGRTRGYYVNEQIIKDWELDCYAPAEM